MPPKATAPRSASAKAAAEKSSVDQAAVFVIEYGIEPIWLSSPAADAVEQK